MRYVLGDCPQASDGGSDSRMETQYLKPIHTTDSHLTLKGRIKEQKRNFVFIEAEIYNAQDEVCTKAAAPISFSQEKKQKRKCTSKAVIRKKKRNLYKFDSKSEFFLINIWILHLNSLHLPYTNKRNIYEQ